MVGTSQTTVFEIANSGRFSGTAPSSPSHSTVYAKAIFDDHGSSRSVTLTMSVLSGLLPTGAYASDWYFNSIKAPLTHISYVSGDHANSVDNGTNAFKTDITGGNFDVAFHFSGHNHDISGGEFLAAIYLQGYDLIHDDHGKSAWISGNEFVSHTPEPESYAIFLAEVGLIGFIARRRKNKHPSIGFYF